MCYHSPVPDAKVQVDTLLRCISSSTPFTESYRVGDTRRPVLFRIRQKFSMRMRERHRKRSVDEMLIGHAEYKLLSAWLPDVHILKLLVALYWPFNTSVFSVPLDVPGKLARIRQRISTATQTPSRLTQSTRNFFEAGSSSSTSSSSRGSFHAPL